MLSNNPDGSLENLKFVAAILGDMLERSVLRTDFHKPSCLINYVVNRIALCSRFLVLVRVLQFHQIKTVFRTEKRFSRIRGAHVALLKTGYLIVIIIQSISLKWPNNPLSGSSVKLLLSERKEFLYTFQRNSHKRAELSKAMLVYWKPISSHSSVLLKFSAQQLLALPQLAVYVIRHVYRGLHLKQHSADLMKLENSVLF